FVKELAGRIGGNFQLVPIAGFDELMAELASSATARQVSTNASPSKTEPGSLPLDMRPSDPAAILNNDVARDRLGAYSERLGQRVPSPISDAWLRQQMLEKHLVVPRDPSGEVSTVAGALLLGESPQSVLPAARIDVSAGQAPQSIVGNLWSQVDGALAA